MYPLSLSLPWPQIPKLDETLTLDQHKIQRRRKEEECGRGGGLQSLRIQLPRLPKSSPDQIKKPTSKNNSKKKKPTAKLASIWTQEDEIKILEGIIEHAKKINDREIPSIRTLLAAIALSLLLAATDRQLRDKIWHLKTGYDNASDSNKPQATGHKGIVYRLCDTIWPASPAIKEEEEEEEDSYDSEDYPELRIAVERRAGHLLFEEVVESLSKDEAESFNERFWKLREDEKKLWKEIHERLQ